MMQLFKNINPLDLRGSWKTSLCGIVALICGVAWELEMWPEYGKQLQFISLVAFGIGLMFARDVDKRSEDHNLPTQ